jgi:phage-related minor tail protein
VANRQSTLEVIFAGTDEVSPTIGKITSEIGDFGSVVSGIGSVFADVIKGVAALDIALAGAAAGIVKLQDEFSSNTKKIQASIGTTAERAEELGEIAQEVWADAFGASSEEAAKAVALVEQKFKDFQLDDTAIKESVKEAFAFEEIFGANFDEVIKSAGVLMREFDLPETDAFDFIAKGFQDGLNSADDFLETINEYSTQFTNSGATADQFFSIIKTGFEEGVLGTDKAADAFKEFTIKMAEYSDDTSASYKALQELDLVPEELSKLSKVEAFQVILNELNKVTDASERARLGAELIGTQYEDLGSKAKEIDIASVSMKDLEGASKKALEAVQSLSKNMTAVWRSIAVELTKIDLFKGASKSVEKFLSKVQKAIPKAFEQIDFSGLEQSIEELMGLFGEDFFGELDLTTPEGLAEVFQYIVDGISSLVDVTRSFASALAPVWKEITAGIGRLSENDKALAESVQGFIKLGVEVGKWGAAFVRVLIETQEAGTEANRVFNIVVDGIKTWYYAMRTAMSGAATYIFAVGEALAKLVAFGADILGFDKSAEDIEAFSDSLRNMKNAASEVTAENFEQTVSSFKSAVSGLDGTSATVEVGVEIDDSEIADLKTEEFIKEFSTTAIVEIDANTESAAESVREFKTEAAKDPAEIKTEADKTSLVATGKEIKKSIPDSKTMKIEADLEKAKIQADAKKIDAMLDFKAKVNVAEIEAAAEKFKSLSGTIQTGFESTGEVITSSLDALSQATGTTAEETRARWQIEELLVKENEYRQKQVDLQREQFELYKKEREAKMDALVDGEALIKVTMDSRFDPALEMLARQFIQFVQIEATQEGLENLIGL